MGIVLIGAAVAVAMIYVVMLAVAVATKTPLRRLVDWRHNVTDKTDPPKP
jgi:hypothetical protein